MFSIIFDLLLPEKCIRCEADLTDPDPGPCIRIPRPWPAETAQFLATDFSVEILGRLPLPARILCPDCWLALEPAVKTATICEDARLVTPFFTNGPLLAVIHFLKFSSGRTAAPPLSWWLAFSLSRYIEKHRQGGFLRPLVIPVPLHPSRERSRGYNQSAVLARHTASRAGIDTSRTTLRRIKRTRPQANLEPGERADNMRGAFALADGGIVRGRDIIVVDDLVTTGETVRACIAALRTGRPASMTVLAVGRPKRFGNG